MPKVKGTIHAKGTKITVISSVNKDDFISLTDIAKHRNSDSPKDVVKNWLRNRSTIEFLGLWEELNNPNFNRVEFDSFKNESGSNAFTLSPQKWISSTNAVGLISKSGKYGGGTYAHTDIAFEFASWISPEFKLYIIKDYQRLKEDEHHQNSIDWNVKRLLAKANYKIHTDAVKENLIPESLTKQQQGFVYANEADILNVALFGRTAAQWRKESTGKDGNMRDYATIEQLLVMTNLENANAIFIQQGMPQGVRLGKLRDIAVEQLIKISGLNSVKQLGDLHNQFILPTSGDETSPNQNKSLGENYT